MPNSDTDYGKKDAASEALLEATALLVKEQFQAMPTARDVAKKSGYSVGTLYRYFGSVGGGDLSSCHQASNDSNARNRKGHRQAQSG